MPNELEKIKEEVHENNLMLKEIIKVINYWLMNHRNENEDDFGRNILANLISNAIDRRQLL